jgi:hypothetical protein
MTKTIPPPAPYRIPCAKAKRDKGTAALGPGNSKKHAINTVMAQARPQNIAGYKTNDAAVVHRTVYETAMPMTVFSAKNKATSASRSMMAPRGKVKKYTTGSTESAASPTTVTRRFRTFLVPSLGF